jgi:hypothetical protein
MYIYTFSWELSHEVVENNGDDLKKMMHSRDSIRVSTSIK